MKKLYMLSAGLLTAFSVFAQSPRTVLLETRETTQLTAVAPGICAKEDVKALYGNNLAVISFHDDNIFGGGDPLFQQFAANWATFFGPPNYPSGLVDRVSYNGTNLNLGISLWTDTIAARINRPAEALVTLPEVLYDDNVGELFARVQINFDQQSVINRDLRFFLYLVQDGVISYQLSDTNMAPPCSVFTDTLDTTYNFTHNDVAIANPSAFDGVDNIIAQQPFAGDQFTTKFSFDLPAGVDLGDVKVVAFVANYTPSNVDRNEVLNAAVASTFTLYDSSDPSDPNHPDNPDNPNSEFNPDNWPTGLSEIQSIDINTQVYPNPVSALGIIEFQLPEAQEVQVDVLDMSGRSVKVIYNQYLAAGKQLAAFNGTQLPAGSYIVRVQGEKFVDHTSILIAR